MSILLIAVCLSASGDSADELDHIDWEEAAYPLIVDEWRLSGPGAVLLSNWAAKSQFVLFGEQHGLAQVPQIVGAVYMRLFPQGYEYLALEMGPWFAKQVSQHGMTRAVASSPHSFAFDYDGQVYLIDLVESVFEGRSQFIWGLDQTVIAIHPFARLSETLPNAPARRAARGLFLKAALQRGEYLRHDNATDLNVLRQLAGPGLDEESALILDALDSSMQIYVAYRSRERDGGVGVSDRVREQYMCDRLQEQLAIARSHGEDHPRVIFLMGGAHIMEGIGPNGVPTLGDHAQKLATANGLDAVNIGIREYTAATPLPQTVFSADSPITLIDARSIRDQLPATIESGGEEHRRLLRDLQQFDAMIFIKGAKGDERTFVREHDNEFKLSLLLQLSVVVLPAAAFLSLPFPFFCVLRLRLKSRSARHHNPIVPWVLLTAALALFLLLIVVQLLRLLAAGAPQFAALSSDNLFVMPAWITGTCVFVTIVAAIRQKWWSTALRVHFLLAAVCALILLCYCHWWNVGAMLG